MNMVKDFITAYSHLIQTDVYKGFNTLNDLSNKLCVPDKTEDLNFIVFKMIT